MYAPTAIRFIDPFALPKDCSHPLQDHKHSRDIWTVQAPHQDINQFLTPPPEMAGVESARPSFHATDYSQQHVDYVNGKPAYRASLAPYQCPDGFSDHNRNRTTITSYNNARTSPPKSAPIEPSIDQSQQRRGSQYHNAIASNFQIPRSVNESGGSLSELAAQVSWSRVIE